MKEDLSTFLKESNRKLSEIESDDENLFPNENFTVFQFVSISNFLADTQMEEQYMVEEISELFVIFLRYQFSIYKKQIVLTNFQNYMKKWNTWKVLKKSIFQTKWHQYKHEKKSNGSEVYNEIWDKRYKKQV